MTDKQTAEEKAPAAEEHETHRPKGKATKAEEPELPYTVGEWSGHPTFACKQCNWDTTDPAAMETHLREAHGPPPPDMPKVSVKLFDQHGNEIQRGEG